MKKWIIRIGLVLGVVLMFSTTSADAQTSPPTGTPPAAPDVPPVTAPQATLPASPPTASPPAQPTAPVADEPEEPPSPLPAGAGIDGMFPAPDLRGANQPTLAEKYPISAYTFDTDLGYRDVSDKALNSIANVLMLIVAVIGALATRLFQWAFSLDLLSDNTTVINDIVAALSKILYEPWLPTIIILAGGWMLWHGVIRRRTTTAMEGVAWVLAAGALSVAFLAQPGSIVSGANTASNEVSKGILSGVAVADVTPTPTEGPGAGATYDGDKGDTQLRKVTDRWWRTFVFQPWGMGEFGSNDLTNQHGEVILESRSTLPGETLNDELAKAKKDKYNSAKNSVKDVSSETGAWFNGHRSAQRIGVALLALIAITVAAGLLIVIAGVALMAQTAVLMLVVFSPLFLVVAMHPGVGRRLMIRWLELLVGALFKKVLYSAALAVVLVTSSVLLAATSAIGWAVSMAVQIILIMTLIVYRKAFVGLFAHGAAPGLLGVNGVNPEQRAGALSRAATVAAGDAIATYGTGALSASGRMAMGLLSKTGGLLRDGDRGRSSDSTSEPSPAIRREALPSGGQRLQLKAFDNEGRKELEEGPVVVHETGPLPTHSDTFDGGGSSSGYSRSLYAKLGPTDTRQWPKYNANPIYDEEGTRWAMPAPKEHGMELSYQEQMDRQHQREAYWAARDRLSAYWRDADEHEVERERS